MAKVYQLLNQIIPEHIRNDYPTFCFFLEHYYRWLSSKGFTKLEEIRNIDSLTKVIDVSGQTIKLNIEYTASSINTDYDIFSYLSRGLVIAISNFGVKIKDDKIVIAKVYGERHTINETFITVEQDMGDFPYPSNLFVPINEAKKILDDGTEDYISISDLTGCEIRKMSFDALNCFYTLPLETDSDGNIVSTTSTSGEILYSLSSEQPKTFANITSASFSNLLSCRLIGAESSTNVQVLKIADNYSGTGTRLIVRYLTDDVDFIQNETLYVENGTMDVSKFTDKLTLLNASTLPSAFIDNFIQMMDTNNLFDKNSKEISLILKNIRQVYLAKGTEEALIYLLKASKKIDAEIKYPWEQVLKPSDGEWKSKYVINIRHLLNSAGNRIGFFPTNKVTIDGEEVYDETGEHYSMLTAPSDVDETYSAVNLVATFTTGDDEETELEFSSANVRAFPCYIEKRSESKTEKVFDRCVYRIEFDEEPPVSIDFSNFDGTTIPTGEQEISITWETEEGETITFMGEVVPIVSGITVLDGGYNWQVGQIISCNSIVGGNRYISASWDSAKNPYYIHHVPTNTDGTASFSTKEEYIKAVEEAKQLDYNTNTAESGYEQTVNPIIFSVSVNQERTDPYIEEIKSKNKLNSEISSINSNSYSVKYVNLESLGDYTDYTKEFNKIHSNNPLFTNHTIYYITLEDNNYDSNEIVGKTFLKLANNDITKQEIISSFTVISKVTSGIYAIHFNTPDNLIKVGDKVFFSLDIQDKKYVIIQTFKNTSYLNIKYKLKFDSVVKTNGYWSSEKGKLSSDYIRIEDSNYYQQFAYDIIASANPDDYSNLVKYLHPVGVKRFFTQSLETEEDLKNSSLNVDTSNGQVVLQLFETLSLINKKVIKDFTKELTEKLSLTDKSVNKKFIKLISKKYSNIWDDEIYATDYVKAKYFTKSLIDQVYLNKVNKEIDHTRKILKNSYALVTDTAKTSYLLPDSNDTDENNVYTSYQKTVKHFYVRININATDGENEFDNSTYEGSSRTEYQIWVEDELGGGFAFTLHEDVSNFNLFSKVDEIIPDDYEVYINKEISNSQKCNDLTAKAGDKVVIHKKESGKYTYFVDITKEYSETYYSEIQSIDAALPEFDTDNFNIAFAGWKFLKSVPINLFENNPDAINFDNTFGDCQNLSLIPEGIFDYNKNAKSFAFCFAGCTGISSIPRKIFYQNLCAENFVYCFAGCSNIVFIPDNLFKNQLDNENFDNTECFLYCTKLES